MSEFIKRIKSYMMPISMGIGTIFYPLLQHLSVITPFLIFLMLFITYCNISLKDIKPTKLHIYLLAIQIIGCFIVYGLLYKISPIVAQGAMICVLAPTATSAVVICSMLGGNSASLAAYSLLSNITVAIVAPITFAFIQDQGNISFFSAAFTIMQRVGLLLILPLLSAIFLKKVLPPVHKFVRKSQAASFYLWNIALMTVTAKTIHFIVNQENPNYTIEVSLAIISCIVCVAQFAIGRRLGRKFDDTVAGGQGLGQKNTILAIWMAQTYLNPISSIAPGAYVLWQNIINSYQVWKLRKQ